MQDKTGYWEHFFNLRPLQPLVVQELPQKSEAELEAFELEARYWRKYHLLFRRRRRIENNLRLGRVYFIQHPNGLIKIGFTATLKKRFRELQLTEHPNLILLGSIEASMRYEKRLHKIFDSSRSHKEWFFPVSLLKLYIEVFTEASLKTTDRWNTTGFS